MHSLQVEYDYAIVLPACAAVQATQCSPRRLQSQPCASHSLLCHCHCTVHLALQQAQLLLWEQLSFHRTRGSAETTQGNIHGTGFCPS